MEPQSRAQRNQTPASPGRADLTTPAHETEPGFKETEDYTRFKACILQKTGIDLNLYKQSQMYRRLFNMVERANVRDFMEYYHVLERDPQAFAAFLDRMTINVSELFRNPEKWQELRTKLLPSLLAGQRTLKVWSAGCSYGAEPYSLAILLDQIAPGKPHTIHATDLDQKILAKAREGLFSQTDVRNLDRVTLDRYFTPVTFKQAPDMPYIGPAFQVKPDIRSRVKFRAHNLLADRFENGYDLICCRNVVIYFTDEAKEPLYARFCQALSPGGILFVGGTERIFDFQKIGLDSPLPFFYRRIPTAQT
jgi:chemotaxis protein methyltransferase CheR